MFRVKLNSVFFYSPAAHDLLFSAALFTENHIALVNDDKMYILGK